MNVRPTLFLRSDGREHRETDRNVTAPATATETTASGEESTIVGIPAYNEADTIGKVARAASRHADEVFVVDDGSTDETKAAAQAAGGVVVEHETNRGYGAALMTLFEEAADRGASHLVTLDGDGQHKAADVSKIVERLRTGDADIVIGSRFLEDSHSNPPLYRRFGIGFINFSTNLSLHGIARGSWLSDTQSGFRAYGPRAIESVASDDSIGDGMGASLDIIYHARRHELRIEEVGVSVDYHDQNTSTRNPINHGLTLVADIVRNTILR